MTKKIYLETFKSVLGRSILHYYNYPLKNGSFDIELVVGLQMDIISYRNTTSNELNKGGLHLNLRSSGNFMDFISRIKKFAITWRVRSSFHQASIFDSRVNFRFFTNLGNIEKSNESAITQLNGIYSEETLNNNTLNEIRKEKN